MLPTPLHPAVVHFPIVLMLFLPMVTAVLVWRLHDGARRRTWGFVTLTAVLLVVSGVVAKETGEDQKERVERVLVSEQPLEAHQEAADVFLVGAWLVLGVSLVGFAGGVTGTSARLATLAGAIVVTWLGWRVGDRGGKLVYEHGAASAYVGAASSTSTAAPTPAVGEAGEAERDEHR
jgi:uncharacterized membrane protein